MLVSSRKALGSGSVQLFDTELTLLQSLKGGGEAREATLGRADGAAKGEGAREMVELSRNPWACYAPSSACHAHFGYGWVSMLIYIYIYIDIQIYRYTYIIYTYIYIYRYTYVYIYI